MLYSRTPEDVVALSGEVDAVVWEVEAELAGDQNQQGRSPLAGGPIGRASPAEWFPHFTSTSLVVRGDSAESMKWPIIHPR